MSGTFSYFGEDFSFAEEYPSFLEAEFHEARTREDLRPSDAIGYALRLAEACVAPDDRGRFKKVSRANNAKIEDWIVVYQSWTEVEAERPTGQPTDLSDGQSTTEQSSGSQPVASVTSLPERAPRADLQLAVTRSVG